MKKFTFKLFFYFLIFFILCNVISIFIPYHWGNPWYSVKINYLENNETIKYNTYFFGSSRVYRQIDPDVFSMYYNLNGNEKINAFNLGAPAIFCPQSYFLYEKFLDSDLSKNAKFCFIELTKVDLIGDHLKHQERTTYWQNFSDVRFAINSIFHNPKIRNFDKMSSVSKYMTSYVENIFHIGHYGQQLLTRNYYDEKYLGSSSNGFFPIEQDLITTNDDTVRDHLRKRKNELEENPELLKVRIETAMISYENNSKEYDLINLNRINSLISKSEERGIHLVFLLSPRNNSQELIDLVNAIPNKNVIDMSNPAKYRQLYRLENSFDVGHLNTKGSIMYSKFLAKEFMDVQKYSWSN